MRSIIHTSYEWICRSNYRDQKKKLTITGYCLTVCTVLVAALVKKSAVFFASLTGNGGGGPAGERKKKKKCQLSHRRPSREDHRVRRRRRGRVSPAPRLWVRSIVIPRRHPTTSRECRTREGRALPPPLGGNRRLATACRRIKFSRVKRVIQYSNEDLVERGYDESVCVREGGESTGDAPASAIPPTRAS